MNEPRAFRRGDNTYAVFHNGQPLKQQIPEQWFFEQICHDYGFCGEEAEEIRKQIEESGKCTLVMSASLPPWIGKK